MEINGPKVVAEVTTALKRHEAAPDELFWDNPPTVRYGVAENLCGYGEIKAFHAGRSPAGNTLFRRSGRFRQQSQTRARMPENQRVVSAHVGPMPEGSSV